MSFSLAAQISTSHSSRDSLSLDKIYRTIENVQEIMPLSILITGAREVPEIFQELTDSITRPVKEVYLWYNLLSDYPKQSKEDLVVNYRGKRGGGWAGWQESGSAVEETFSFGCPNNPITRQKTLSGLTALLQAYPFDGVFLDKFRFPSPANGLEMVLSCFCPHCCEVAQKQGLDLHNVASLLEDWKFDTLLPNSEVPIPPGSQWLEALVANQPLLKRFLRFRADSVTSLVGEVNRITKRLGRKIGLDLFTPAFAPLVGQDYTALAPLADWAKPMTYRRAYSPAGLRLEAEDLLKGVERIFGVSEKSALTWLERTFPLYSSEGFHQMLSESVPMEWMRVELRRAVAAFQHKPVLMGLETVNFPGVIEITPALVAEVLQAGLQEGVQGAVISWDLLNTPIENIRAIKDCLG